MLSKMSYIKRINSECYNLIDKHLCVLHTNNFGLRSSSVLHTNVKYSSPSMPSAWLRPNSQKYYIRPQSNLVYGNFLQNQNHNSNIWNPRTLSDDYNQRQFHNSDFGESKSFNGKAISLAFGLAFLLVDCTLSMKGKLILLFNLLTVRYKSV